MTLYLDIESINNIVNTLSIRCSIANDKLQRSIYTILDRYVNINTGSNNQMSYLLPIMGEFDHSKSFNKNTLTGQLISASTVLKTDQDVIDDFSRLNRIFREHRNDDITKVHQDSHMFISMLNKLLTLHPSIFTDDNMRYKLYGYRDPDEIIITNISNDFTKITNKDIKQLLPSHIDMVDGVSDISHRMIGSKYTSDDIEDVLYFIPIKLISSTRISTIVKAALIDDILEEGKIKYWNPISTMIVKMSSDKSLLNEIEVYKRLISMNATLPNVIIGFNYLGNPVLLLEEMESIIGKSIKLSHLIRDVLGQLKVLHKIGIHCDIKPDNIMKSGDVYYLIDFGGTVLYDSEDSKRYTYTPVYSSQRYTSKIPSIKNDLIEFMYTINAIYLSSNGMTRTSKKSSNRSKVSNSMSSNKARQLFHHHFEGPYERAWKLVSLYKGGDEIYDEIIDIFK